MSTFASRRFAPRRQGYLIRIPPYEYWQIDDAVPAGAVWWDPSNGSDSNDGSSKALAKQSFAAAETLATTTKPIILAGGAPNSTTYHHVPTVVMSKSGTSDSDRMKLFAEPGRKVVLISDDDFLGALLGTWTWTLIDGSLKIWESPNLGIPEGVTTVTFGVGASVMTNALTGSMLCPHGPHGRPYLMKMFWYGATQFVVSNTGANAGKLIKDGGYGGPGFHCPGNGRIRVRMQKVTSAYQGTNWPRDGRMGTCVNPATGLWQEPITENPNDYAFRIVRQNSAVYSMNFNGRSWWHVKGINLDLHRWAFLLPDGSGNNLIEKCTVFPVDRGVTHSGNSQNHTFRRVRFLTPSSNSLSRTEHKTQSNYWAQHGKNTLIVRVSPLTAQTGAWTRYEHCTIAGWFDMGAFTNAVDGIFTFDHCAILDTIDDGFTQSSTGPTCLVGYNVSYTYFGGGPVWSGSGGTGLGTRDWIWHHCVIDNRYPAIWDPLGSGLEGEGDEASTGARPHRLFAAHAQNSTAPAWCKKMVNCTIISAPDTIGPCPIPASVNPLGVNIAQGRAYEVYNCIIMIMDSARYSGRDTVGVSEGVACDQAIAGTIRFDHNCYWRSIPGGTEEPYFLDSWKNSYDVGTRDFASLAEFKASPQYALSASMYVDGTAGHEEHGYQDDPGISVERANRRDYRPTNPRLFTGAKNVTAFTGGVYEPWIGAVDPNGPGTEIGPQDG